MTLLGQRGSIRPRNPIRAFQECRSFSLWPWPIASAADESGVVRKIPGPPWRRGGWKAHDHGMFDSGARAMYRPSLCEVSPHISSAEAKRKHSQPVQRDGRDGGYLTSKERTASKRVTGTGGAVDRSRLGYARCLARDGSTPRPPPRGCNITNQHLGHRLFHGYAW